VIELESSDDGPLFVISRLFSNISQAKPQYERPLNSLGGPVQTAIVGFPNATPTSNCGNITPGQHVPPLMRLRGR
jgi:hypothetical protein